ncbi:MAG: ATP-binding protein, partial [Myxococcales bacterium]
ADGICIAVSDTGTGIPAGQLVVIFERFRQVGPKLRSGLGLGLYIAKSIVDAHGGTIWAADHPEGEGATVTFTLPAPAKPPQINSQIISKIQA